MNLNISFHAKGEFKIILYLFTNLIKINNWDFEWQGFYFYKTFLKIPAGSMIYAKGNYDNTVSATNPNPVTVQSGLNTADEMFIFIFQFLPYQLGDENISIENGLVSTNIYEATTISSLRELLKITSLSTRIMDSFF